MKECKRHFFVPHNRSYQMFLKSHTLLVPIKKEHKGMYLKRDKKRDCTLLKIWNMYYALKQ